MIEIHLYLLRKFKEILIGIFQSAVRPKLGKLFVLTFLSGSTFTIFTFAFQPFVLKVLNQDAKASYLSISNAIGPPISGMLVSLGYKSPFWITGVLTILTACFAYTLKSEFKCEGNR